jgi:hypothetical protein
MAQILDRVYTNVNACGIEVAFQGVSVPSVIAGWQPFYNETFQAATFQKAYASISSINFQEVSTTVNGNTSYKQKIEFRFPSTDGSRAERIALLQKIKFLKVKLNNGADIVIGRNDVKQNAFPNIKAESTTSFCGITIETQSISPAGFTPNINQYALPSFIPLSF